MLSIIDLETTTLGLDCGLVQIGAILVDDDLDEIDSIAIRCHPRAGTVIDLEAMAVNGYHPGTWSDLGACPEAAAIRSLDRWLRTAIRRRDGEAIHPVAHGAHFDAPRLQQAAQAADIQLPISHRWECTQALARSWRRISGQRGRCGLKDLAIAAGYWTAESEGTLHHDALEDCRATLAVLTWLESQLRGDPHLRFCNVDGKAGAVSEPES